MKQNRLVSRLPFSVFNCQGSRHHPAGHADKVLLAENHRHRVYGVGLRPGGHLRQVLRPNTGKALRNAQRPVHAANGLYCLPGKASGLPGVIKAADVGLHRMGQGSGPVSAVTPAGRDTVSVGSKMAHWGIKHRSFTAYLWWVSSVTTAAMAVSDPVLAPAMHSGLRQGSTRASRPKQA